MAGLLVPVVSGCSGDDHYVAPTAAPHSDQPSPSAAAHTLSLLERAIRSRDAQRAARLGDDDRADDYLATLVHNAAELRLTATGLHYLAETGQVADDGGWTASVEVTWKYGGFDRSAGRTRVDVSFGPDGTTITSVGPGDGAMPLWLTGRVVVRRNAQALVVASPQVKNVDAYAREARRAVAAVADVLGPGPPLVVEVPGSVEELNRAIDVPPGTENGLAGVTDSSDGTEAPGSAVHVFLNPAVYGGLDPVAAQLVMTHEATHAATYTPLVPDTAKWLVEGFADYVALHDTTLPPSRTAAQVIALVRKRGLPDALPSDADFASEQSQLGALYEEAWLVCVTLADHGGQQALIDLYRAVLGGQRLATALRRDFGWSVGDLTKAWQQRLASLAGVPQSPRG